VDSTLCCSHQHKLVRQCSDWETLGHPAACDDYASFLSHRARLIEAACKVYMQPVELVSILSITKASSTNSMHASSCLAELAAMIEATGKLLQQVMTQQKAANHLSELSVECGGAPLVLQVCLLGGGGAFRSVGKPCSIRTRG
jgi:hypothetical protein